MASRTTSSKRTEHVPKDVGRWMRHWRHSRGMSLQEVGEAIGVQKGHLSGVERGKGNLSLPKFLAYCNVLGVPASKVLRDAVLPKERDVERLTLDLAKTMSAQQLARIAALTKRERDIFLERGFEAVELDRLRRRERARHKDGDDEPRPTVLGIHRKD